MATTYTIRKMRVVRVSGKVAEKNPERVYTVYGTFYKEGDSTPLSITQKNIDIADVSHPDFNIDTVNGILTINEGRKGRRAFEGLSQEAIEADLKALRGE